MAKQLTITLELDEYFKKLAESLPPMQIAVNGIPQTTKGKPLYVDHHAEILCHYMKGKRKAVKKYAFAVVRKHAEQTVKLKIVK